MNLHLLFRFWNIYEFEVWVIHNLANCSYSILFATVSLTITIMVNASNYCMISPSMVAVRTKNCEGSFHLCKRFFHTHLWNTTTVPVIMKYRNIRKLKVITIVQKIFVLIFREGDLLILLLLEFRQCKLFHYKSKIKCYAIHMAL